MAEGVIWIVVNAEDTQGVANGVNAQGALELVIARIASNADMLYRELCEQAMQLKRGDRIVMHQGGARRLGGQRLVACGTVSAPVVPLTLAHVARFPRLWGTTQKWYKRWPATPAAISREQIIFYELKGINPPAPSPKEIRPKLGDKFLALHPNCALHKRCTAYKQIDHSWRSRMGNQYPHKFTVILDPEEDGGYSVHCPALPGCSSQGNSTEEALDNIREAILGVLKARQDESLLIARETHEIVTEEIRQILAERAEDGLPLTIETREVELPTEVAV